MLDTSVRFPTHEVNQFNSSLPLRGQGPRPTDAALASFASQADEPTDTPTFQPVRDTLFEQTHSGCPGAPFNYCHCNANLDCDWCEADMRRDTLAEIAPTPAAVGAPRKTVRIPATATHEGHWAINVTLDWICPVCGGPRGEIYDTISYDGSRRLGVNGWRNPCGHVDYYDNVRDEAKIGGGNG